VAAVITPARPGHVETNAVEASLHRSVTRAFRALEAVAASDAPLGLTTLAARLGTPKSTLHSLLKAMVARRYLDVDRDGNYRLAVRTVEIGAAYLNRITPLKVARPELVTLSRELEVTAHFAVLDGTDALYLAKEDAPGVGIRLASAVGTRLPAQYTAVGKANLAHLDGGAAKDNPALAEELAQIRRQGYAVDEGMTLSAVRCIAAPVFDVSDQCCGAIGISYLREGGRPTKEAADHVVRAAGRASQRLGAKAGGG
jgi:DNA-binding IclR family transcriptional regulator